MVNQNIRTHTLVYLTAISVYSQMLKSRPANFSPGSETLKMSRRKSENVSVNGYLSTPKFTGRRFTTEFKTPDCFSTVDFESPLVRSKAVGSSAGNIMEMYQEDSSVITVGVRVRPFTKRELEESDVKCIVNMIENETIVTLEKGDVQRFTYDYSFWSFDQENGQFADQAHVYQALALPLLSKVIEGYNTCLFAYGQTGSGKSYSIMGHHNETGIIPRFCEDLFQRIENSDDESVKFNVEISFFEIYNEKIHDLLGSLYGKDKSHKRPTLKVREHPMYGPYVEGLSSYVVKTFEDVCTWLSVGNKRRATASTGLNDNSSRSHSVFTLILTQNRAASIEGELHEHNITSKISLVDLAGSERQSLAKTSGDRLREGANINKSLMTLGKVISLLSEHSLSVNKKKKIYIPYRESVLTWLLKESLGGNSKTSMLATISPSNLHTEETLSALRYAKQARSIVNRARINEDPNARLIRNLRAEIEKLKMQTGGGVGDEDQVFLASLAEIKFLKEQLSKKEKEMVEVNRSWQERLKKSEACKLEESRLLEKAGVTLKVDGKLPSLVNLNEDPQLSEVLLYVLRQGSTRVGQLKDDSSNEIQLSGPLISEDHCTFEYNGATVTVTPSKGDAMTYINGVLITEPTVVHHGDRVVIGDHYFRFNHPMELPKDRTSNCTNGGGPLSTHQPKDFDFARQELTTKQNARLEAELEKERMKHQKEMEYLEEQKSLVQKNMQEELAKNKKNAENIQLEFRCQLAGLQQRLAEHGEDRDHALEHIRKLENEKECLERKLNVAKITQSTLEKTIEPVNYNSDLLEFLERTKQNVHQSIQQNEMKINSEKKTNDLHRILLMLHKANKISDALKKDTKFTREIDDSDEADNKVVVKVLRVQLDVCTFWSIKKFEMKLDEMRELFRGEIDKEKADDIFFDPADVWESDTRISLSPVLTKQHVRRSLGGRNSFGSPNLDITFGSLDLTRSSHDAGSPTSLRSPPEDDATSDGIFDLCQMILTASLDQFNANGSHDLSTNDRFLCLCHRIYESVNDLQQTSASGLKQKSPSTLRTCLNLSNNFDSLLTYATYWLSLFNDFQSEVVIEIRQQINQALSTIGSNIQLFLQGFASNIESMMNETHREIVLKLHIVCEKCGQLSLMSQANLSVLANCPEDNNGRVMLNNELKKHFMIGCDELIDRFLANAIHSMEENELRAIDICEHFRPSTATDVQLKKLLQQTQITVSSALLLLRKLQNIQVELNETLQDCDVTKSSGDDYYANCYGRCLCVSRQFSKIVDSVFELMEMMSRLVEGEDEEIDVNAIKSCLEVINSYSTALVLPFGEEDNVKDSICLDDVLTDSQIDLLEMAVEDLKGAVGDLESIASNIK